MKPFKSVPKLGSYELRASKMNCRLFAAKTSGLQPENKAVQSDDLKLSLLTASAAALLGLQSLLAPCVLAEDAESRIQFLKGVVEKDFVDKQYYVTGKLTKEVFEPSCLFTDPTTRVEGKQAYPGRGSCRAGGSEEAILRHQ
jgi:hypothetical protein